jgi:hypothetical protein
VIPIRVSSPSGYHPHRVSWEKKGKKCQKNAEKRRKKKRRWSIKK